MTGRLVLPKLTDERRDALADIGVTSAATLLHEAASRIAEEVNARNDRTGTTTEVVEGWLVRAAELVVGEGPERLNPATLEGWDPYATSLLLLQAADSTLLTTQPLADILLTS